MELEIKLKELYQQHQTKVQELDQTEKQLSILEPQVLNLQDKVKELKPSLDILSQNKYTLIKDSLSSQATQLEQRDALYKDGREGISKKKREKDEEVIRTYEQSNLPEVKTALEQLYQQAKQRVASCGSLPLTVLVDIDETQHRYLLLPIRETAYTQPGLMRNLAEWVCSFLIKQCVPFQKTEQDQLLKIVLETDEQVKLGGQPDDFSEANVSVDALDIAKLLDKEKSVEKSVYQPKEEYINTVTASRLLAEAMVKYNVTFSQKSISNGVLVGYYIRKKVLPAVKKGKCFKLKKSDLDTFIKNYIEQHQQQKTRKGREED